jgi:hypothetical protein
VQAIGRLNAILNQELEDADGGEMAALSIGGGTFIAAMISHQRSILAAG